MSADAWITLVIVLGTIAALAWERYPAWLVMIASVVTLTITGVIDEQQAFAGFSNEAPITVAALYVLAGAAEVTGGLEGLTLRALGSGGARSERRSLARMLFPTMALSGFVANTPLISILAPRVVTWCRRNGLSASRYLMPVSYAAVLGGVITVMGTSTNLTISGLLREAGMDRLDLLEVTPVGLPVALAGVVMMVLVAPRLLPNRTTPGEQAAATTREFTIEFLVEPGGPLVGRSIEDAGLRHLSGVYLVALERDGMLMTAPPPDEALDGRDRLFFAGDLGRLLDLQRTAGLVLANEEHVGELDAQLSARLFEVVISPRSTLVGSTLRDAEFRARFGGAVIAIHRAGERLVAKAGDVELRPGDVLLVLSRPGWHQRWQDKDEFLMIVGSGAPPILRRRRARIAELCTAGTIVLAAAGVFSLLEAAVLACMVLLVTRTITPGEARAAVHTEIIVIMAMSIALGSAVASSGLATELGGLMVDGTERFGDLGLLFGILITTMVATELLSNNAAAALVFPIALASAAEAGVDPMPLVIAVLIGASCSFVTPIGYQTNTLVYGMGGYRFSDFTIVGLPLSLTTLVVSMVVIPLAFPF